MSKPVEVLCLRLALGLMTVVVIGSAERVGFLHGGSATMETADDKKPVLAFFAHERGDARVRKRIAAFMDLGWRVRGYTFHRERDKEDAEPAWENVHLGTTYNRRYVQRVVALAASLGVVWRERKRLADAEAIYAVNTDNALLAMVGRWFSGEKKPLILELADVQPAMTGGGVISGVLRAVERFVLERIALLVTTSPGFVRSYFEPVQRYEGEVFLLENKVYPSDGLPALGEGCRADEREGGPWVIGYFGAFRCRRSLELIRDLCETLGEKVCFVLRGYGAGTIGDEFDALVAGLPNLKFGGPYAYPGELAEMYAGVDLNWAFDESDPNGNSAWLLPNRIYEGGCFGVPAIAAADTETGRWIEGHQVGWTVDEPLAESLAGFLADLDRGEWKRVRRSCRRVPREVFTGEADYLRLSERILALTDGKSQDEDGA